MPEYPFQSEITMFTGTFAPKGSMYCHGQILNTSQHQALFALLGNRFGGNGTTTFALPDFRGDTPVGNSFGTPIHNRAYNLGEKGGSDQLALHPTQLPQHSHTLNASSQDAETKVPSGQALALTKARYDATVYTDSALTPSNTLNTNSMKATGQSRPFSIRSPYTAIQFVIWSEGVWPPRD